MSSFIQDQLDFLLFLSEKRTPIANDFFTFLNFLDTEYFFFLLIPVVWIGLSWRWGIRLFYLIVLSASINYVLKEIFAEPRPFAYLPGLALIKVGQYSFPSGAAQSSALLGGFLIYAIRSKTAIFCGIFYPLLLGFSRLYLGVHFPTDILAGFAIGALIFLLFIYFHKPLERAITKRPYLSLCLVILFGGFVMAFYPHKIVLLNMSAIVSGSVGIFFSLFYKLYLQPTKNLGYIFLRSFLSICGTFVLFMTIEYFLSRTTLDLFTAIFETSAIGIWISLAASPLIKYLIPSSRWMSSSGGYSSDY